MASQEQADVPFGIIADGLVGFDMHGKTVGLIGTGKIGKIAGQIFKGFGTRVIMWDPYPDREWAEAHEARLAQAEKYSRHLRRPPAFSSGAI